MAANKEIISNQSRYSNKYEKIIVTYYDGETKEFTPIDWATFEKGVSKIAKNIEFVELKPKRKQFRFFDFKLPYKLFKK